MNLFRYAPLPRMGFRWRFDRDRFHRFMVEVCGSVMADRHLDNFIEGSDAHWLVAEYCYEVPYVIEEQP